MDWPKDSACLSDNDLALRIFEYNPSPSLAIQILQSNAVNNVLVEALYLS